MSKRAKQGHKEVKGKRKHEEQPEGRKLSIAARALGLHESLGTPGSKQSAKSRKAKAKSSKAKEGEEEDEDSLDSDEEKEKPMWGNDKGKLSNVNHILINFDHNTQYSPVCLNMSKLSHRVFDPAVAHPQPPHRSQ